MRRMAVWLAVLAAASIAVLVGSSWAWVVEQAPVLTDSGGPTREVVRTGADLAPVAAPAAWAALAGLLATIATRGRLRMAVGALITGAGAAAALSVLASGNRSAGALLALVGSLAIAAAGSVIIRQARSWPELGRRYEPPGDEGDAGSPWDALDRGDDPTDPGPRPA